MLKRSPVVAIGVDRRGVGRDDGACLRLLAGRAYYAMARTVPAPLGSGRMRRETTSTSKYSRLRYFAALRTR